MANLYLHYAFDAWLIRQNSTVKFARYADDAIIHCRSQSQANWILTKLKERMHECGLELHLEKTKIVYCKDYRRKGNYSTVQFDFLGYSFQPRTAKSKRDGQLYLGYDCAISKSSKQGIIAIYKLVRIYFVFPTHTFKK